MPSKSKVNALNFKFNPNLLVEEFKITTSIMDLDLEARVGRKKNKHTTTK